MVARARAEIVKQLRRMIITGELAPGSVVTEAQLTSALGCGRTPLREALQRLAFEYQLFIPPRRGILIPQLDIVDFHAGHEATLCIGNACIELSALRINDEQLRSIKEVIDAQGLANEERRFYDLTELDSLFHNLTVEAAGNQYLTDSFSRMYNSISRFVYKAYVSAGNAALSLAEHAAILEALESRDPELAQLAFRNHIANARQRILRILGLGELTRRDDIP